MKRVNSLLFAAVACATAMAAETPDCTLTIDSQEAFDQWTSIDANNDRNPYLFVYSATDGGAVYEQNKSNTANDWLISPAVSLEAGASYDVTFSVRNLSTFTSDKQTFTITAGNAATVEAMTTSLFTETSLAKTPYNVERGGAFTATESGDYYFGVHLTSSSYQGNFLVQSVKITKKVSHPGAVTGLTIEAGAEGTLTAELSWTWPTVNDLGGVLSSVSGAKIYRGTSSYFTVNDASLVGTLEAPDAVPGGAASWTDETVPSSGKYYYKVVPFNADGASTVSPGSVQSPYIGMATSIGQVQNLHAAATEGSDTSITLSWDAPSASEGYFNPADVAYKITRSKDGASAVTLEESWQGAQPYVDNTIDGLGSYKYTVYTVFNGTTAWSGASSNAVVTGGALSLPYTNYFSSSSDIALWTLFHGPDGSRDWSISSSTLNYWGGPKADAWAVTPAFELQPGKTYSVKFTTRISTSESPKQLAVAYGDGTTAEALTTVIFDELVESTFATEKTFNFSVPKEGKYYVGFHCYGASNTDDLYVDNLTIEEGITAPAMVTDAIAEPAEAGALSVLLSWTNPTKDTADGKLTTIDRVEISDGETIVATLTDVTPGSQSSQCVEVATPGEYSYTITAWVDENPSEMVEVKTPWVGYDIPLSPAEVSVIMDEEGARVVDFSYVTEGVHGGYIDHNALQYIIKRNEEEIVSGEIESPWTDDQEGLPLAMYTYSVAAVNGEYTGAFTSAAPLAIGDALGLPYEQAFESADDFSLWTMVNTGGGTGLWKWDNSKKALANSSTTESWAITPPVTMHKGECELTFKAACWSARYTENLKIMLLKSADSEGIAEGTLLKEYHVESVSYPSAVVVPFDIPATGRYYVAFGQDEANWTCYLSALSIEQVGTEPDESGIDSVETDNNADVRYYNLQGIETASPTPGQIVIKVSGNQVSKEVIR